MFERRGLVIQGIGLRYVHPPPAPLHAWRMQQVPNPLRSSEMLDSGTQDIALKEPPEALIASGEAASRRPRHALFMRSTILGDREVEDQNAGCLLVKMAGDEFLEFLVRGVVELAVSNQRGTDVVEAL